MPGRTIDEFPDEITEDNEYILVSTIERVLEKDPDLVYRIWIRGYEI